jgi:hypothetical protein
MMKYILFIFLFYLGYVPFSGYPAYNELKFPVLSMVIVFLGFYYRPTFNKIDTWYGLFLLLALVSLLDIRDIAWAWQPLFSWIAVLLLAIWGRPFFKSNEILINVFLQFLYWATISYFFYHILLLKTPGLSFFQISYMGELVGGRLECHREYYYEGWPHFFKNNFNMAPMVPLILLAPVLFGKYFTRAWWIYRILAAIPAFYLVYYFDSQLGVIVSIFYLLMIPYWYLLKKILLGALAVFLGAVVYFRQILLDKFTAFLAQGSLDVRIPYDLRSIEMVKENPLNGTGLGSWFFEAGNGLVYNHNYHTKLLAEIGPLGWLVWILPVFILFFQRKKENAGYAMLLGGFYVACLTLRPAVSDYVVLSEVHLMGILGYGLATMDKESFSAKRWTAVFSLLLPLWFSFNFLANHFHHKAKAAADVGDYCKAIDYLSPYYIPGIKTTVFDVEPINELLQKWEKQDAEQ